MTLYQRFCELPIEPRLIGLEKNEMQVDYFCTPRGTRTIGFENCIQYCFIRGYGETVFAVNPESCADQYVYPLAKDFRDFLRLILACGSTTAVEQIILWTQEQFLQFLSSEDNAPLPQQLKTLEIIRKELRLTPMEDPYTYVKNLQADFDLSKLYFSDEYYKTAGLPLPEGRKPKKQKPLWETAFTVVFQRKTPD